MKTGRQWLYLAIALVIGCGPGARGGGGGGGGGGNGVDGSTNGDGPNGGVDSPISSSDGGNTDSFNVYAHDDYNLYSINVQSKQLVTVGPFDAPNVGSDGSDVITDLAVAPDNTIYVISETAIYTASATTGHVTKVGSLAACGNKGVALTTTTDGKIYEGDFSGKICNIDISGSTPVVGAPVTMSNNMALSGDFVAVDDGTVFGTAYNLSDSSGHGTQLSNVLVKIDVTTGAVTQVGATGAPKLFGVSFADGKVFGFEHGGSGQVFTIDTTTGVGTPFASFSDGNGSAISWSGAGVNPMVPIID